MSDCSEKTKEVLRNLSRILPDSLYLRMKYYKRTGKRLNLKNPTTYTEKLQWLKLYDRKPEYTVMVDKYEAKKYVAERIGEEHIIPLLGVWDDVDEIDFDALPDQFVIKCTHDSGGLQICRDKACFDVTAAKKSLRKILKRNFYLISREWPYKNVKPRIIAEKYMQDAKVGELRDYKFFAFDGVPKVMYIATGRGTAETYGDFFDMDFNHLTLDIDHRNAPVCPVKPACFEKMKDAAAQLSKGVPQLRVDFYEVDGQFYFGEMTFFHCGGFMNLKPDSWNKTFGDWVSL